MTWFKVDDGFHKHRKRIRAGLTMEGLAAIGLWTVAGSWSADELTDGFVPDDVMDYLAPGIGQDLGKRLEFARLWQRNAEGVLVPANPGGVYVPDGGKGNEPGWQFHQWEDHQPTREQVMAERAAAAERQRRARDKARENRDNHGQNDGMSRRDSRVSNSGSHGGSSPAVTGPPSRPVPTRPDPTSSPPSPPSLPPARQQLADYGLTDRETTKLLELLHANLTIGNEDALTRKLIDNGDIDRWITKMRAALDDDTPRHRLPTHDFDPSGNGVYCARTGCGMPEAHGNHKTTTAGASA